MPAVLNKDKNLSMLKRRRQQWCEMIRELLDD